jgi:hypothetical protein
MEMPAILLAGYRFPHPVKPRPFKIEAKSNMPLRRDVPVARRFLRKIIISAERSAPPQHAAHALAKLAIIGVPSRVKAFPARQVLFESLAILDELGELGFVQPQRLRRASLYSISLVDIEMDKAEIDIAPQINFQYRKFRSPCLVRTGPVRDRAARGSGGTVFGKGLAPFIPNKVESSREHDTLRDVVRRTVDDEKFTLLYRLDGQQKLKATNQDTGG